MSPRPQIPPNPAPEAGSARPDPAETGLQRRHVLRGGALAAGVAGATVVGAALNSPKAAAADGDPALLGRANAATSTTAVTANGTTGSVDPTLTLTNAGGPTLRLTPGDEQRAEELRVGEILTTNLGPYIGVTDGPDTGGVGLVTELDLPYLVTQTVPFSPQRLVDTRFADQRGNIVGSSAAAFDASRRLKAGAFMDIAVDSASGDFTIDGAHINLTSTGSTASGVLTAYPSGPTRPRTSTLNFPKGVSIANGALVAVSVVPAAGGDVFAFRIYTTSPTHVVVDLTGLVVRAGGINQGLAQARATMRLKAAKTSLKARITRALRER